MPTRDARATSASHVVLRDLGRNRAHAYGGTNPSTHKRWDRSAGCSSTANEPARTRSTGGATRRSARSSRSADTPRSRASASRLRSWGHRSEHVAERRVGGGPAAARRLPNRSSACSRTSARSRSTRCSTPTSTSVSGRGVRPGRARPARHPARRLNGGTVIAVDGIPGGSSSRVELGAEHVVDRRDTAAERSRSSPTAAAPTCRSRSAARTGRCTRRSASAAYNARVVAPASPGRGVGLRLGEEFHHNRIRLVCSQISGVPARRSTTAGTRRGSSARSWSWPPPGGSTCASLVTHTFPATEVAEAFRMLDRVARRRVAGRARLQGRPSK